MRDQQCQRSLAACIVAGAVLLIGCVVASPLGASPVTTNLTVWLDASDDDSLTIVDGRVAQWTDTRGSGIVFNQSTASQRPTVSTGAASTGLQTVRFDPTMGNWLRATNSVNSGNYFAFDGYTIFAVFRVQAVTSNSTSPWNNEAVLSDSSGFVGLHLRDPGDGPVLQAYHWDSAAQVASQSIVTERFYVVTMQYDGDFLHNQLLFNDPASLAVDDLNSGLGTRFLQLGKRGGTNESNYLDGDIAELLIYDASLSLQDRTAVVQYLSNKWMPEPTSGALVLMGGLGLLVRPKGRGS